MSFFDFLKPGNKFDLGGSLLGLGPKEEEKTPETDPLIGEIARGQLKQGQDWLDMAKAEQIDGQKRQDITDALTGKVVAQQLATQDQANAWGAEDRARAKSVFQPLQDQFIATANSYDSADKQDEASAEARSAIAQQAAAAQQSTERNLASMGVSPTSGRAAGITRASDLNTALASAGAGTAARVALRDKAVSLRGDALNIGNGLASSAAAAYGIGTNAGNSAVGNNIAANGSFNANNAAMNPAFNGVLTAGGSAGGMLNTSAGVQAGILASNKAAAAQESAGKSQMMGSLAGAGVSLIAL